MPLAPLVRSLFARRPAAARRPSRLLEKLEDRRLFDAAVAGDADPAAQGAAAEPAPEAADTALLSHDGRRASAEDPDRRRVDAAHVEAESARAVRTEIVFVDPSIEDADRLLADLHAESDPGRDFEVVLLGGDGLAQIGRTLEGRAGVEAVHVLSHGEEGAVRLGDVWLTADTLKRAAGDVAGWGSALSADGDLLIYGCDLAGNSSGVDLLDSLATLTGADVAASDDATGHADLGGDWVLEYRHGEIQARGAISEIARADYRHLLAVGPTVTLDVPADVPIGQDFTFTATFENTGADAGYGPFVDLLIPSRGADGTTAGGANDGVTFNGATYLGSAVTATTLEFTDANGGVVDHPYAVDSNGDPLRVTGTVGDTLVVLQLPFGSFAPEQPEAAVEISASVSGDADLGTALAIRARAGFQYGDDPLENPASDPSDLSQDESDANAWNVAAAVTPSLMTLTKTYQGPENETASGPNHARTYTIAVDVAEGQTITDLDVFDDLPPNLLFESVVSVTGPGGAAWTEGNQYTVAEAPPTTHPVDGVRGRVRVNVGSVTGGAGADDVVVVLRFHVPEYDADAYDAGGNLIADPEPHRIIPVSGEDDGPPSIVPNNARALGDWTPTDARDAGATDNAAADPDPANPEHVLDAKSIAVQKSVENVTDGTNTPGDLLKWTISFQISDYHTFGDLEFGDVLTDGQRFEFAEDAKFTVTDRTGTSAGTFNVGRKGAPEPNTPDDLDPLNTLVVDESRIDFGDDAPEDAGNPGGAGTDGSTALSFDLSEALIAVAGDHADGVMHGGRTDGPSPVGAVGTLTFYTRIQQDFADTFPSGDRSVDHGDTLSGVVDVRGSVRDNADETRVLLAEETDASAASLAIAGGTFTKGVAAINGEAPQAGQTASPGDRVTYSLKYTLPSSDFEGLTLTDYLPQPVFRAGDPDADGAAGPAWRFEAGLDAGGDPRGFPPPAGTVTLGADDTFFRSRPGVSDYFQTADISVVAGNAVKFDFGTYDDPGDAATTIHLLFTVTVADDPFADGLRLTNIARAVESNTAADATSSDQVVQITLAEPDVHITKGVVSTDSEVATLSRDPGPDGVTFADPGSTGPGGAGFTGTITSDGLASGPVDADVAGLDAGDVVKFAIVLENRGAGGGWDLKVSDQLPPGFVTPADPADLNLTVTDGSGEVLSWDAAAAAGGTAADLFGGGLRIFDPGPLFLADDSGDTLVTLDSRDDFDADNNARTVGRMDGMPTGDPGTHRVEAIAGHPTTGVLYAANTQPAKPAQNGNDAQPELSELGTLDRASGKYTKVGDLGAVTIGGVSVTLNNVDSLGFHPTTGELWAVHRRDTSGPTGSDVLFKINPANGEVVPGAFGGQDYVLLDTEDRAGNRTGLKDTTQAIAIDTAGRMYASDGENLFLVDVDETNATATLTTIGAFFDSTVPAGDPQPDFKLSGLDADEHGQLWAVDDNVNHAGESKIFRVNKANAEVFETRPFNTGGTYEAIAVYPSRPAAAGLADARAAGDGSNVIVLTYDLVVAEGVTAGRSGAELKNAGTLNFFAGRDGGPDHTTVDRVDAAQAATAPFVLDKRIVATSESHTGEVDNAERVVVGEVVRYRLTVEIPEGTHENFRLRDLLPSGMSFLEDGTATAALVSDGGLTADGFAGAEQAGDEHTVYGQTPQTPTFQLTDGSITSAGEPDRWNSGDDPTFSFGTLENRDSDADREFVVVEFNAVANNATSNHQNASRAGAFEVITAVGGDEAKVTSDSVGVRIAEPRVTVTQTRTSAAQADAGDTVSFTLTLTADGAAARATAFDVLLTDAVPDGLENVRNFSVVGAGGAAGVSGSVNQAKDAFTVTADSMAGGSTITVTFDATVSADVNPSAVLKNHGDLTWTSLAGAYGERTDWTGAAATSSDLQTLNADSQAFSDGDGNARTYTAAPGQFHGERTGAGHDHAAGTNDGQNDYGDRATASLSVPAAVYGKTLFETSDAHTDESDVTDAVTGETVRVADATIGETVTYALRVELPEGETPDLKITDLIPAGLAYESFTLVTTRAASETPDGRFLLDADFAGAVAAPAASGGANAGDDVTFDFASITVTGDGDANNDAFLLLITARVADVAGNAGKTSGSQTTLTNAAAFDTDGDGTAEATHHAGPVTVVEPELLVTKEMLPESGGQAGDTVTVTVTVENTGTSTAFDLVLTDDLADGLFKNVAPVTTPAGFTLAVNGDVVTFTGNPGTTLGAGDEIEFEFTADLTVEVGPNQTIDNTAVASYSSRDDAVTAPGETPGDPTGERDASGSGDAALTTAPPKFSKFRFATSDDHTDAADVAIGETVTYALAVDLPEGTTAGLSLVDLLPPGLDYTGFRLVTQADDSFADDGEKLLLDDFGGTRDGAALAASDFTATGGAGGGDDVTFTVGEVVVPVDGNALNNRFLLLVDAVIVDRPQSAGVGPARTDLANTATLDVAGDTDADGDPIGPQTSNEVTVTVAEPDLRVTKSAAVTARDGGDAVTYTVTVSHTDDSNADAHDLALTDLLADADLALVVGSVTATGTAAAAAVTTGNGTNDGTLRVDLARLARGETLTVTFEAKIADDAAFGDAVPNTASATFDGLGGAGGRGGAETDGHVFTLDRPTIEKTRVGTSVTTANNAGPDEAVVGELVTYRVTVTLPEGEVDGATVLDSLDANLEFVAVQSVTFAGDVTSSETDFTPTVTGNALSFDFGTLANPPGDPDGPQTVTLVYTARVRNVAAVQGEAPTVLNGTEARFQWDLNGATAQTDADGAGDVTVIEPRLTVDVTASDTAGDAGDPVVYTITVKHADGSDGGPASETDAFDVTFSDPLPPELDVTGFTVTHPTLGDISGRFEVDPVTNEFRTKAGESFDLLTGQALTITLETAPNGTLASGDALNHTAAVRWTSLDGDAGAETGERTGAGGMNDYRAGDAAPTFTADRPAFVKALVGTSVVEAGNAADEAAVGELVTYRLEVTVPEGTTAGATIADALPPGLDFVRVVSAAAGDGDVTGGGTPLTPALLGSGADRRLEFDLGDLVNVDRDAGAETFVIVYEARVANAAGNQEAPAAAFAGAARLDYAGDQSTTDSTPAGVAVVEPVVTIGTEVDDESPVLGQTVTYTLVVAADAGGATAHDLRVTDVLPDGVTLNPGSIVVGGVATPTDDPTGESVDLTLDSLAPGGTVTITFTAEVTSDPADVGDTFADGAAVSWTSLAGDDANERDGTDGWNGALDDYRRTDADSLTVRNPDLSVTIDDGETAVAPGQTRTYAVTVTNAAGANSADAAGATVTLPIDGDVYAFVGTDDAANVSVDANGTLVWTPPADLAPGGSVTLNVELRANATVPAGVDDVTLEATVAMDQIEPTPADTVEDDTDDVLAAPDLHVATDDGGVRTAPNGSVVYATTYGNRGPQGATGVTLTQTLPDGAGFDAANSDPRWSLKSPGVYEIRLPSLTAGTTGSADFAVVTDPSHPAGREELATAATIADDDANGPEPTSGVGFDDETDSDVTPLDAVPELAVTVGDAGVTATPGGTVTYTLSYANAGPQGATNATLTFTPPAGTTFSLADNPGWADAGDGTFSRNVGALRPDGSDDGSVDVAVAVDATHPAGRHDLVAAVSLADDGTNGPEANTANNAATEPTPLNAAPDVTVALSAENPTNPAGGPATAGGPLVYTLDYENAGPQGATGVTLAFTPPPGVSVDPLANPNWTLQPGGAWTRDLPDLASGDAGSVTFAVTVDDPAAAGREALNAAAEIDEDGANGPEPAGHEPNVDSLVTPLAAAPDLVVTIDDGQVSTDTNEPLVYRVTYDNVGDQTAGDVTLTVTPPPHATVDQASLDAGWALRPDGTYALHVGALDGKSGSPGSADFFVTVNDRVPAAVETLTAGVTIADAANETDPTPANNADSDTDTVGTTPDLFVVTTDDIAAVTPGGRVTYAVEYGNKPNGQDATGVFLTHVVPAGATFDPAASDAGWFHDGADGDGNPVYRLDVGDLASGSPARAATFAVVADGPVDALREGLLTRATIADDGNNGPDPNGPTLGANDNEDPETTPLTALPDLFVTLDDGDAPLSAGGPLTLTVGYGNVGNQDVSGATLTIVPPAGTTVSAADRAANELAGWVEQPDESWTNFIGDLAADPADDGAVDFLVTVTDPVAAGRETVDSAASIRDAAADEETNRANNAATDAAPLAETPDLTVQVTADVSSAGVGDSVVFTLDYANVGDQHASGSFLTFTPPAGTTPDGATLAAGWTPQPNGSYRFGLNTVNADATGSVTFGVTVDGPVAAGVESLTGRATVGDDGAGGPDPTPENNAAADDFAVLAAPDLAVDTDDLGVTAVAGGTLTYAVTVRNLGDQFAGDVRVIHAIPEGTTLSAASIDGGWLDLGDGTVEFTLGPFAPGGVEVLPLLLDVDDPAAAARDRLDATATVRDAAFPEPDADPSNDVDLEETPLVALPDYVVTVDDGLETVGPGGRIRWTVTVENVGDQDGTGVVVTDRFPPGLLENVIASGGGAVDPATGVIRWDLGDLAGRGGAATFAVTGTIPAVLPAGVHSLTHTARVTDDLANGPDPTPANNVNRDTDRLDFAPDLRVTVTDRRTRLEPGDRPTWTVTVTNAGDRGATGVVLRDQFPPGVLDAVIADGGASVNPRTGVVTWTVGDLAVGETRTFAVSGTVKDTLPAGFETLTHAADAADDGRNGADPTPANNAAADTDALDAAATLDVEIGPLADDLTPGDETDVIVTVTNRGDRDAGPTVLVVSFPKDVLDALEDRGYEVDARAGTVTFRFDDLPAGESVTVDFGVRVAGDAGTTDFGVSAVASASGTADASDAGAGAVTGVTFAYDAFRNEAEPGRTQFAPTGGGAAADAVTEDDRDPRTGRLPTVRPLFRVPARVPVSPMFTGTAEPGTMLTAKIYDADGNLVGERQTVADTAGNWLLSFPGTVLYEQPERMEFTRTAAVQQAGGPGIGAADGQFALRRFFHPVGHASLFFSERPTVGGALGGAAGHALHAAHEANRNPLRFGFAARHWSLAASSPTTGQA